MIYGSEVLERGLFGKIGDFLFGRSPDMDVRKPWGVAWDGDSRLLIADTARKGIQVLDFGTGRLTFFDSLGPQGRLGEPVNVISGGDNRIYVADTGLRRVVVLDGEGDFL